MSSRLPIPRRIHPRRRTLLRLRTSSVEARVVNLSVEGLFAEGVEPAFGERGELLLPGRERPVLLQFRHAWGRDGGTAAQFALRDLADRRAVAAHVAYQREQDRVRRLEARLALQNLRPVPDQVGLRDALRALRGPLQVFASDGEPTSARVVAWDPRQARLRLGVDARRDLQPFSEAVVLIPGGGLSWIADTLVADVGGDFIDLVVPERLFVPERRTGDRDPVRGHLRVDGLEAELLELDSDGLRLRADHPPPERIEGAAVQRGAYADPLGPLRRAWSRRVGDRFEAGYERVRERVPFRTATAPVELPAPSLLARAWDGVASLFDAEPRPWVIEDPLGRPLVTLVDASFDLDRPPRRVHAVLVPPAYARRKEHPSALAQVLVASFRAASEPVVVLRWDGIDHVGESWSEQDGDHAMLRYTQRQCVEDLGLVVRALRERLGEVELRTAVVSFSLAAVAVRRYLATGGPGIDLWLAPMGAADARDTIRAGNGGVDLVGARKRGEQLGVQLIQGHLVDADHHCDDLLRGGFAELDDARADMACIVTPVTWLVGSHDHWVNRRRVEDILAVPAPGPRELVEVPVGHQLRTSEEALGCFKLLAERLVLGLAGHRIQGVVPSKLRLWRASERERARLAEEPFDREAYWHSYLLGRGDNPLGFDLLTLTDEYQDLLETELGLLAPVAGARIADLGCGTGNVLAALASGPEGPSLVLEGVDFVPDALRAAREKVQAEAVRAGGMPTLRLHRQDLRLVDVPNLPFADASLDAVILSLVLPYLESPERVLAEARRALRPGGRLVISTLRPDADMGGPVARLREKIQVGDGQLLEGWSADQLLAALQAYMHDAAALLDGEVQGRFRFFGDEELRALLKGAGLRVESIQPSFGGLARVALARRPGG